MRVVVFIMCMIIRAEELPGRLESCLAFILDPIIKRSRPFESWLYRQSFDRANRAIEREARRERRNERRETYHDARVYE